MKYDSVLGILEADIQTSEDAIIVNDKKTKVFSERDPGSLPWNELGIPIVIEATGLFRKRQDAIKHIEQGGAKKVIISAPAPDPDVMVVLGVNDDMYDPAILHPKLGDGRFSMDWNYLKWVASDEGHLSNEQCAELLAATVTRETRHVFLAHISENHWEARKDNNSFAVAKRKSQSRSGSR